MHMPFVATCLPPARGPQGDFTLTGTILPSGDLRSSSGLPTSPWTWLDMVATRPIVAEVTDPSTAITGPGRALGVSAR